MPRQQKTRRAAGSFRLGWRIALAVSLDIYSASTLTKVCFSAPFFANFTRPGLEGEQRVIGADADVRARAHRGAALADQDVAGEHGFTAELLHAETFAVRFAAVTSTAACLFMCHVSLAPTI